VPRSPTSQSSEEEKTSCFTGNKNINHK